MLLVPMPRAHRTTGVAVADVFSPDIYTGNGTTQTITNGVNLSANGGLVWIKERANDGVPVWYDTARSFGVLRSHLTNTEQIYFSGYELDAYNSSGFTVALGYHNAVNSDTRTYVAWTFRKAAKFFDIVTYTGTGSDRTIAHNLGSVPGMIIVKRRDSAGDWQCYHRSLANTEYLVLNTTAAVATGATRWNSTTPTSSVFSIGTLAAVNESGGTYVAYLFAHDPTGIIDCGSYTGNGSATGPTVTLGWQPQFLMIKRTSSTGDWRIYDSARSTANPRIKKLLANSNAVEDTAGEDVDFNATSFQLKSTDAGINASGGTYIYMAIKAE